MEIVRTEERSHMQEELIERSRRLVGAWAADQRAAERHAAGNGRRGPTEASP